MISRPNVHDSAVPSFANDSNDVRANSSAIPGQSKSLCHYRQSEARLTDPEESEEAAKLVRLTLDILPVQTGHTGRKAQDGLELGVGAGPERPDVDLARSSSNYTLVLARQRGRHGYSGGLVEAVGAGWR